MERGNSVDGLKTVRHYSISSGTKVKNDVDATEDENKLENTLESGNTFQKTKRKLIK